MIIGIPEILLGMALVVLPIACLTNWAAALKQLQQGEPLIPTEYVENVPWGLLDVGVIAVIVSAITGFGVHGVAKLAGIENPSFTEMIHPSDQGRLYLIFGTATLIATAACHLWIRFRYQQHAGVSRTHAGADVELGMRWFVMLVVPVLLMQLGLTRLFESRHPLAEMLMLTKNSSLLPIAAFVAIVAAPVFEESLFRMYVQGWLEKLQVTASRMKAGIGSNEETEAVLLGGVSSACLTPEADASNPFRRTTGNGSGKVATAPAADVETQNDEFMPEERPVMWVPIIVSSGLFAAVHIQHGPDWIPLFFLALGLGYLYQRTRRLLPCIVVHAFVNSLGVIQLWSHVRQ